MGSAASRSEVPSRKPVDESVSLDGLNVQQLGDFVGSLDGLSIYKANFTKNGISGAFLSTLDDAALEETLEDIGVDKRLHKRQLIAEFVKIRTKHTAASGVPEAAPTAASPTQASPRGGSSSAGCTGGPIREHCTGRSCPRCCQCC